jgi:N-acetylglucosaminyldiphosphoundecaprenol N-acetyl-beta-D-mannosaminyltransferase
MWPPRVHPVTEAPRRTFREDMGSPLHEGCLAGRPSTVVNGVRIDSITPRELLGALGTFITCGRAHTVHFLAADPTVLARRDERYRGILNRGALNVPDGTGVAWAASIQGYRTKRLPGTDAMPLVAGWGLERGVTHYLFGGTPRSLSGVSRALGGRYSGIRIVGAESPPFRELSDDEMRHAAGRMRAAGAQVVWVGLGTPKQDLAAERLRRLDAAPVIACVGAAFDFLAGTKRRAPRWMQESGLEWLHRLASEPERLWKRYMFGNPAFVAGVLTDLVTSFGGKRRPPS